VASRDDLLEAYRLAVIADPISAFGGIVAFNCELTVELAKELREFRSPTDGASSVGPPCMRPRRSSFPLQTLQLCSSACSTMWERLTRVTDPTHMPPPSAGGLRKHVPERGALRALGCTGAGGGRRRDTHVLRDCDRAQLHGGGTGHA
jgi:hypothetical protein